METSLFDFYGNNEPYKAPDPFPSDRVVQGTDVFWQLITGPSTNFYVGPEQIHYTIPKRLFYQYSDFGKPCLEGQFAEAEANAVWLLDVSPDVFQWLWTWFFKGRLRVEQYYYGFEDDDVKEEGNSHLFYNDPTRQQQTCETLCQVLILGERLLMNDEFVKSIHEELLTLVRRAKDHGQSNPFAPQIIEQVLTDSAPLKAYSAYTLSLRQFLLEQLCNYDFCAAMDFVACARCFELDGDFAVHLMGFMAGELKWAVELWGAQTESVIDVTEKKLQLAREAIYSLQALVTTPKEQKQKDKEHPRSDAVDLALRSLCTFHGCTETDFSGYARCFELDGGLFAAEILTYMAGEMRWVREMWGKERGPEVNVAQEKETEEWNENHYDDIMRLVNRDPLFDWH